MKHESNMCSEKGMDVTPPALLQIITDLLLYLPTNRPTNRPTGRLGNREVSLPIMSNKLKGGVHANFNILFLSNLILEEIVGLAVLMADRQEQQTNRPTNRIDGHEGS